MIHQRSIGVWSAVTAAAVDAMLWAAPDLGRRGTFTDLLVAVCAWALVTGAAWAWWVTTIVVIEELRGRPVCGAGAPAWARRAMLGACGLAVVTSGSAWATPGDVDDDGGRHADAVVAGLPFPDRATGVVLAAPFRAPTPPPAAEIVVRPGNSLWSISARALPLGTPDGEVAAATRRLYDLNRRVVGADPDLIIPGQHLRTPVAGPER